MAKTRQKILCIENDAETAALIAEELIERGFEVVVAHGGREGLQTLMASPPDLVLCDIGMPVMTGFPIIEPIGVSFRQDTAGFPDRIGQPRGRTQRPPPRSR